jgi:hypothetical protein
MKTRAKPKFDTTSDEADASAFTRAAFDIDSYRRDGLQVIKDFFEPEVKARFKALGERVIADAAAGRLGRSAQFALGVDLQQEVRPAESAALTAVAQELLGKDIGQFYMRLLMKDENFKVAVEAHQDWPYFGGNTNKLNVFIPLSHCGADNGMVKYYVGSHIMGPVERGDIDVVRYPQFEPVIPELEVGDVLLADFLTWHSSIESLTSAPRIMVQIVLQPLSDPSTSFQFGRPPEEWGASILPRRTTAMRTARPNVGIVTVKEMVAYPAIDEAARMARGLCFDSPMNVEARLLLAEIINKKGDTGDNLLHGLSGNGFVSGLLENAEEGLVELSKAVDVALGRPSRLTLELTKAVGAQLEASKEAEFILQRDLRDSRNELSQSAGELWQSREDVKAAQAEIADLSLKSAELSAELTRIQAELTRSQEALASVLASASWKLTAPLRRMVSAIKRR